MSALTPRGEVAGSVNATEGIALGTAVYVDMFECTLCLCGFLTLAWRQQRHVTARACGRFTSAVCSPAGRCNEMFALWRGGKAGVSAACPAQKTEKDKKHPT